MANILNKDKQIAVISGLAEGASMRALTRMTGIHRDTICRLAVRVGQGCARLMDQKMRNLDCHYLQLDEIWGFIGKKEKHLSFEDDPTLGDVWTFCAIDSETKIVPSFKVGKRNHVTANAFLTDIASRLRTRPQISNGWPSRLHRGCRECFWHGRGLRNDYEELRNRHTPPSSGTTLQP